MRETGSAIVTMQETKVSQVGQIKLDGYFTYECVRTNTEGGGVAISAKKMLQPAFVSDGGDDVEAISIDRLRTWKKQLLLDMVPRKVQVL